MTVLCIFLLVACYYDYLYRRIPNWLAVGAFVAGVVRCIVTQDNAIWIFLLNIIFLVSLLYPFFKLGTLGAGDVKLFGVCGGYLTSDRILYFLFFSMLIAAIFSLVKIITERNIRAGCKAGIPLSGPLLCSVILYMGGIY